MYFFMSKYVLMTKISLHNKKIHLLILFYADFPKFMSVSNFNFVLQLESDGDDYDGEGSEEEDAEDEEGLDDEEQGEEGEEEAGEEGNERSNSQMK